MASDPNGWPDPARPGYPMHPERDGWHWLNGTPRLWEAKLQAWNFGDDDGHTWLASPETASLKGWSYLGPCLTPAEVAAAVQAEREALASYCDSRRTVYEARASAASSDTDVLVSASMAACFESVADAIRARGPADALASIIGEPADGE